MTRFGFEVYSSSQFPSRDAWEQDISARLPATIADQTIAVGQLLELITIFETQGFHLSAELTASFESLATRSPQEFPEHFDELRDRLIQELATSNELEDAPLTVAPSQVLQYIRQHNPFYSRWIAFQAERPRRSPSDWEEYAVQGVAEEDVEYAQTIREMSQTLIDLGKKGKLLSASVAEGLKHSHELEGEERYLDTITWLYMAQQDGLA